MKIFTIEIVYDRGEPIVDYWRGPSLEMFWQDGIPYLQHSRCICFDHVLEVKIVSIVND